jgi:hypothetical protein
VRARSIVDDAHDLPLRLVPEMARLHEVHAVGHFDEHQRSFVGEPQREPEVRQHDLGARERVHARIDDLEVNRAASLRLRVGVLWRHQRDEGTAEHGCAEHDAAASSPL